MAEQKKGDDKNLKEREYRDEKGEIHHHTHEYMERKGGESGSERANDSSRGRSERSGGERSGGERKGREEREEKE